MTRVLATGASARYGWWLLNMLGSVQRNAGDAFDRIVAFDLGLTPMQRRLLGAVDGVDVRTVPPFVPHWREGRTWKTWIWTHVDGDTIVWLDAGLTVLRPLDELLRQIDAHGYFVVAQGHPLADSVPSAYYDLFDFPRDLGGRDAIAAGIVGYTRGGEFDAQVLRPTFDAAAAGHSRGFSPDEVKKLNVGLDRTDEPIVRDCRVFRHEQTLLGIHFYKAFPDGVVNELDRFAGWQSRRDHPEQVIWTHRRRGDFGSLTSVRFRPGTALAGRVVAAAYRTRWWYLHHRWLLRPSTFVRKARTLVR